MSSFQWANGASLDSQVTQNYLLPENARPRLIDVWPLPSIPVIDMKDYVQDHDSEVSSKLIREVSRACEDYGFFQIINHRVPEETCLRILAAIEEFFNQAPEEKSKFSSADSTKTVRVLSRYLQVSGDRKVGMWSELLMHPWNPDEDFTLPLRSIPPAYREAIREYAKEIGALLTRLLSLISLGLGLEKDYLNRRLGKSPRRRAQANYYPPCPQPELTLGLASHTDVNALTVLLQSDNVTGLQVIKDEQWFDVDPIPNSLIINLGDQMQVLSNGRYKSVHHRVITNKHQSRVSLAMFHGPDMDTMIGPIEQLIDAEHPPVYRCYRYSEFMEEFNRQEGMTRRVKEVFELKQRPVTGS